MNKQSNNNETLLSSRSSEALQRQQRKTNKDGHPNQQSNRKSNNINLGNGNSLQISNGSDDLISKSKQNGAAATATDSIENITNKKQQIPTSSKSYMIDKELIDDENARGFDYVFPNVLKQSSSKLKDYENSLSSRGDSKFTVKSEQSSLAYQSNHNQNNNSSSINNYTSNNNKNQVQSGFHHQLSSNMNRELDNKSSKVVNQDSQFSKGPTLRSSYQQQQQQQQLQQGSVNQQSSNNLLNQNSNHIHFAQSQSVNNNAIPSQLSYPFENVDSLSQLLKQEQSNLGITPFQNYSQEKIHLLQMGMNNHKQLQSLQQPFYNMISQQSANSNFNNEIIGGGSYGGLNSINDYISNNNINNNNTNSNNHTFNRTHKYENTNSLGQMPIHLPDQDDIFGDGNKGISYFFVNEDQIKEEDEEDNNSTLLGSNLMKQLGAKAQMNHSKNMFQSRQDNNYFAHTNKKLQKQECMLTSNPNDLTNPLDQHRSLNDDSNNNCDQDGENKTLRGLRILSLKVKQIVQEKGQTTYKEVAETLVQNLKNGSRQQGEQEELRDEQNIKRRVYDALNVLIASEVIAKKGKKVLAIPKTNLTGKCLKAQNWGEAKKQQDILDSKREKVDQKRQLVQEYAKKYVALKSLIERNKNNERNTQQNSQFFENFINKKEDYDDNNQRLFLNSQNSNPQQQQQNPKDNVLQTQFDLSVNKFNFPLITVSFNPVDQTRVILKMNKEKQNLKIYAKGQLQTLGDMDILCKLNMDQVPDEVRREFLGEKYLQWENSLSSIKRSGRNSQVQMNLYDNEQQMMNLQNHF